MGRRLLLTLLLLVSASSCWADVPRIVYDAAAVDAGGTAVPDGVYESTFRVYADRAGGRAVWSETVSGLVVSGGRFHVELGRANPLSLEWSRQWHVSVQFGSRRENARRTALHKPGLRVSATAAPSDLAYLAADAPLYEPLAAVCGGTTHPGGNWGANIGSYEGVIAYSNGADTGNWSDLEPYCQDGYQYQCVEYIRRFYRLHLGMDTSNWHANGDGFYGLGPSWGLEQHPNNGTQLPQPDDIMCFDYGAWGHVAIVTAVTSTTVTVMQQNVSSTTGTGYLNVSNGIVYGSSCQGWLHKPGNGDTTAPVISNVRTTGVGPDWAIIAWNTDDGSTSSVDYGLSASYGQSATDPGYATSHTVSVSGLSPNTLYHYGARSTNGSGLTSSSGDYTFTTTPALPGQPSVAVISPTSLSVTNSAADAGSGYYAFRINDGSACSNKFMQANGTVGPSPAWQTKTAWGTKAVTGLTPGTSYTFDVAAAADASGSRATLNRYAGDYVNSPTRSVASRWGSGDTAATFNGSSQYASLPSMGSTVNLSAGFTIECWAKPSSLSTWYPVLQLTDSSAYGSFVNHICFDMSGTGGMRGEVYQSGGCGSPCLGNYYLSPTLSFTAGEWHHYAMVATSGGLLRFYKDGVPDAGQSLLYMPSSGVTRGRVQIGRRDTTATYYWPGSLDEVALYSYALSGSRIAAHCAASDAARYNTEVITDNPVAYWRLGETSGTAAVDNKGGYSPSATLATPSCSAPAITGHPQNQTRSVGEPVAFSLTASGSAPLNYRWRKNGIDIPDATFSSYTVDAVTTADAASYDCVVTNDCGSATSSAAVLTINSESVSTVASAKALADGTAVTLLGPVVSRSFDGFCYAEDLNRAAGIKVVTVGAPPAEGAAPSILGQLATVSGERVLEFAVWNGTGTGSLPRAFGIGSGSAAERLPWGLLVTAWGRASVEQGATDTFTISDGSSEPITVKLHGLPLPADGAFVIYTGALGAGPTLHVR